MGSSSNGNSDQRQKKGKVGRLIHEYGIEGVGDELERAWTADHDRRKSLRELADQFNQKLLRQEIIKSGEKPIAGEVEALYEGLTGDDTRSADQTRLRRRLRQKEVDIEKLENDFVSYQAIRTYLVKYRGVTYKPTKTNKINETRDTANQLRNKLSSVLVGRLDRLNATGDIDTGSLSVAVDIRVTCEQCGAQLTMDELLECQTCNCSRGR